jgi:hypothetical protein
MTMKYYKVTTENEDCFYLENKKAINDEEVLNLAMEMNMISVQESESSIVEEVTEDEFEENSF